MRNRKALTLLAVFCFGFSVQPVLAEEETELEKTMSSMSKPFKKVRSQSSDSSSNADSAKLVTSIIASAKKAVDMTPKWTSAQPKSEQKAFVENYKKAMHKNIKMLEQLQTAFTENRNEDAVALISKIRKHQKASHNEFQDPDE